MRRASWQKTRIKYIADCNSTALPEDTDEDFEFSYIDISNVTQGSINIPVEPIRFGDAPSRARRLAQPGDTVVSTVRTYLRAVATMPDHYGRLVFSTGFAVLHPCSGVDSRFLAWYLQGDEFVSRIEAHSTGVSYPAITATQLAGLDLMLPPLGQQQAVAAFLDRETVQIDLLIEEQQRLVSLLHERRSALLAQALPSLAQFASRLKYLARVQTGITLSGEGAPDDAEWPYLRVANVQVGHVDIEEIKTLRLSAEAAKQAMLVAGDVLMTEGGDIDKLGRAALWQGQIPKILHQNHIFAVRPSSRLHPEYLVYWLEGPVARHYFVTTAKKTTNLASTNKWTLGNLPIECPALDEQLRIVAYLDEQTAKIDTLIRETERFIELARERRSALITAAVTGQIDVQGEAA